MAESNDAFQCGKGAPRLLAAGTMLLEKYRIEQMIGGGGFGQIYRAFDEVSECLYDYRHLTIEIIDTYNTARISFFIMRRNLAGSNIPAMIVNCLNRGVKK